MLMLAVTIIIAAVVAGFSGGMIGTVQKTPNLILDVKIVNSGFWTTSGFSAIVVETSRPIPTRDIKIVTSWTIVNRTTGELETGGSTVMPDVDNINHDVCNANQWTPTDPSIAAPFSTGFNSGRVESQYQFGSYTLVPGSTMSAPTQHCLCLCFYDSTCPTASNNCIDSGAYGTRQQYAYPDPTFIDAATAVLGEGWQQLRAGDTVNVKVIHTPTNKILFNKNVLVTEG